MKEKKERINEERINYKLRRRLLGNMFLLDKPFIIFIAREHDKQEERNTIRSERITAWVSRHLSKISSTLIQGKSREAMKLSVSQELRDLCFAVDDSITKICVKHLVRAHCLWLNFMPLQCVGGAVRAEIVGGVQ